MTRARVLSGREAAIWAGCFLVVAALIVVTRFTSQDADSSLYASLAARLSAEPISRWIAPEWWGLWPRIGAVGLYRDHPVGAFVLSAAVARLGVPAEQAGYVVGVAAGLAALLLIGRIVAEVGSRADARATIVLLQLMPVAFIFRVRANQEYLMLVCALVTMIGIDRARRSWSGLWLTAVGFGAALLIKGLFVIFIMIAAPLWALLDPTRAGGSRRRAAAAIAAGVAAMLVLAYAYDAAYLRVTGEMFWRPYWQQQMAPVEIATPLSGAATFGSHLLFYLVRLLWHPAPWSIALALAALAPRTLAARWRAMSEPSRRGLLFALTFAVTCALVLSPSSRVAERYVFAPTYAIGTAGAVLAWRSWPVVRRTIERLDAAVPALPAIVWLMLTAARVAIGSALPRI